MQTTRTINVTFRLTMRDFFRTLFWLNFRKLWFITIVLPLCVVANYFANGHEAVPPRFVAIFAVIWGTMTFGFPYLGARTAIKNRNFEDVLQYTFSEAGIDAVAKHSSGHIDWTMVTRVTESKAYIMIFAVTLHLIPKTSFSAEDLKDFKALLRSSVSGKVRLYA